MPLRMADYWCDACHARTLERLVETPIPQDDTCPTCGGPAYYVIGAPHPKLFVVQAATKGKDDPVPPTGLNTRAIGEGMRTTDFLAERRKKRAAERRERAFRLAKDM